MPVGSKDQLRTILESNTTLSAPEIDQTVNSAHFGSTGVLDGLFSKLIMEKCTGDQLLLLMNKFGTRLILGEGDDVRTDEFPTGLIKKPCKDLDNHWCWAGRKIKRKIERKIKRK